jgi:hypothetical protein
MNKNLLHSLAILVLACFAVKCELLTAQSRDIKRNETESLDLHRGLALANPHADSREGSESRGSNQPVMPLWCPAKRPEATVYSRCMRKEKARMPTSLSGSSA